MNKVFFATFICFVASVYAEVITYYGFDAVGGTYYDAEKSPLTGEDDELCWAATAANILWASGWGTVIGDVTGAPLFGSEDDIFDYYRDHWTNLGGNAWFAWDWWFDGINDSQGYAGWSQVDVAGGGFWLDENLDNYHLFSADDPSAMANIEYLLLNHYGVALGVTNNFGGHAITAWGYDYDDETGAFLGIWITDSDDEKHLTSPSDALRYYDVLYNPATTAWYLQDFYGYDNWYITEVQGLLYLEGPQSVIPIPASLLIFGFGGFVSLTGRCRYACGRIFCRPAVPTQV